MRAAEKPHFSQKKREMGHPRLETVVTRESLLITVGQVCRQPLVGRKQPNSGSGICLRLLTKTFVPRGDGCANIRLTEVFMARLRGYEGRWSSHPMAVVRRGCLVLPRDPTNPGCAKNLPP